MKNGDVVYFKEASLASHRRSPKVGFKGHAFGILLGHVPPFKKDPDPLMIFHGLGSIGFLRFDDVAEFLGDELAEKCLKMFEDKYYGKKIVEAVPDESSGLVTPSGTPLVPIETIEGAIPSEAQNDVKT